MNVKKPAFAAVACSAALVMSMTAGGTSQAASSPSPGPTWAQIDTMAPDQVAALQNPLIAIANHISSVGSTKMVSLYTSVALDTPDHAVDVYVTDTAKAGQLLQAAKNSDPTAHERAAGVHEPITPGAAAAIGSPKMSRLLFFRQRPVWPRPFRWLRRIQAPVRCQVSPPPLLPAAGRPGPCRRRSPGRAGRWSWPWCPVRCMPRARR